MTDTLALEYPEFRWMLAGRGYRTDVRVLTVDDAVVWLCRERVAHATLMLRLEVWRADVGEWRAFAGQELPPSAAAAG